MLSKSKGQILRVSVAMQVLFSMFEETPADTPEDDQVNTSIEVSDAAIIAAIDFVDVCVQQVAYIAGRGDIKMDIELIKSSKFIQKW